jgi:hypothetical protein
MMTSHTNSMWTRTAGVAGVGALLFTYGCGGAQGDGSVSAQPLAASQAGTPVVVSCEPHQRTLVRPAVVNGAQVQQVECVAADPTRAASGEAYAPVAAQPAAVPVGYTSRAPQVIYEDLEPARVVRTSAPARAARPVQTRQVVYEREPVKPTRSVKKSAIIIGSSAGVGAGVGAAMGGKKGALIGAAIGGGGAAIWDQVTRRK